MVASAGFPRNNSSVSIQTVTCWEVMCGLLDQTMRLLQPLKLCSISYPLRLAAWSYSCFEVLSFSQILIYSELDSFFFFCNWWS